ncbi:MAG: SNF2-related protein, partial [Acidimicrobiales bacterium]
MGQQSLLELLPVDPETAAACHQEMRALLGRGLTPSRLRDLVRALAVADASEWTPAMTRAAWEILAGAGLAPDYVWEPPPVPTDNALSEAMARARRRRLWADGEWYCLQAPFDRGLQDLVGAIPGAIWDRREFHWRIPRPARSAVLSVLSDWGGSWLEEALIALDGPISPVEACGCIHPLPLAPEIEIPERIEGFTGALRRYQVEAAVWAAARRRILLGDEQGLGKTRASLAACVLGGCRQVLVLCPSAVKLNWVREATEFLPGWGIAPVLVTSPDAFAQALAATEGAERRMLVVNYDILVAHLDALAALEPDGLICDESHYLKTPGSWDRKKGKWKGSQRTGASTRVAAAVAKRGGMVMLLSGTPVVNKPAELIPQLKILGRLEEMGGWERFARRYCRGYRDRHGWHLDGHAHEAELHAALAETCMLRRRKVEVLTELPEKTHAQVSVEPDPVV